MSIEYTEDGNLRLPDRDGEGCLWLAPVRWVEEARRAAAPFIDGEFGGAVPSGEEGYIAPEPERVSDEEFELLERQWAEALDRLYAARLRRVS